MHELFKKQLEREELQRQLGLEKFEHQLKQQKLGRDYSRSAGGKLIQKTVMGALIDEVETVVNECLNGIGIQNAEFSSAYLRVSNLPKIDLKTGADTGETITPWEHGQTALIALRTMLDVAYMPIYEELKRGKRFGGAPNTYDLERLIGRRVETQCILNHARAYFPDGNWHQGMVSRKLKEWYSNQASADQKDTVTRLKFRKEAQWLSEHDKGFMAHVFDYEPWADHRVRIVGAKLMATVQKALVIEREEDGTPIFLFRQQMSGKDQYLRLTDYGYDWVESWDNEASKMAFVVLPMLIEPRQHSHESPGGYIDVAKSILDSTVSGSFKARLELSDKHLEFLNQQQSQPFQINQSILSVMEGLLEREGPGKNVGKFKPTPYLNEWVGALDPSLKSKEGLTPKQLEAREKCKLELAAQHSAFKKLEKESKASMSMEAVRAAQICKDDKRLFIPTFSDFRGRTFPRGVALTFQGRDFQKALLNFADAKEVDERTDYWMRISMSADMDLDKLSYEKRCAAIEANRENIINSVRDPIGCDWWKQQASPWMLLHVATEWVRLFVDNDSNRTTKCRVAIDCTCSGQQLMAGWTCSMDTAVQVNLVPADEPADVYGNVLEVAVRGLEGDNFCVEYKSKRTTQPMAKGKLKGLGTDIPEHRKQARKGAKGIIMVGQYGAGRKKRIEEFADNCQLKWLGDKGNFINAEAAALYPYFKDGLDECLPAMDVFLKWAQGVVSAAFKAGREFILIPTADGSCIKQLYPKFNKERIEVDHLGGMTLGKRRNEHVATSKEEPDTEKHVSSTAANFVHAGDGAVLVLALTNIGIPFSTCHDSVSGRPGKDMDLIFDRMRMGMYLVFTSSVCRDFVEANGLKWEDHKLIDYGTYDPKFVLKANYALC